MGKAIQLKSSVDGDKIYTIPYFPIGYIYMSMDPTNPGEYFGGTWEQITSRFLYCSTTSKTTGGASTHTHTGPSHTHTGPSHTHSIDEHSHNAGDLYACIGSPAGNSFAIGGAFRGWGGRDSTYSVAGNSAYASGHPGRSHDTFVDGTTGGTSLTTKSAGTGKTGAAGTGNTGSASSLPPYITVYAWHKTAN